MHNHIRPVNNDDVLVYIWSSISSFDENLNKPQISVFVLITGGIGRGY
jgi:hypothetical protein